LYLISSILEKIEEKRNISFSYLGRMGENSCRKFHGNKKEFVRMRPHVKNVEVF